MAPLTLELPALDAAAEVSKAQGAPSSQAVITLPSSPPAPLVPDSSASSAALDRAADELSRLREDLQGANPRLVAGRLELIYGWVHSDASVRAALSQTMAASEEEKQVTTQAIAARNPALKDASTIQGRCKALGDELQGLRDELAKEVRARQAKEEEMKAWEAAIGDRYAELSADRSRLKTLE